MMSPATRFAPLGIAIAAAACLSTPPPAPVTSAPTGAPVIAPAACDLVCEGAQVVREAAEAPDHHAHAVEDANDVLAKMHPDLLACYHGRLVTAPKAHAFLTVDIVVGADGRVQSVETTGGALLGKKGLACITDRIRAGVFAPVVGGGTRRIHVPFTLRRMGPDETI